MAWRLMLDADLIPSRCRPQSQEQSHFSVRTTPVESWLRLRNIFAKSVTLMNRLSSPLVSEHPDPYARELQFQLCEYPR
jgi:hypothetical protein